MRVTNYNALDWFIWDSYFEKNTVGLKNEAGNFHVYHSVFDHSAKADVEIGNKSFFAFRHNWSFGSARVRVAEGPTGNPDYVAFQGNTILDPVSADAIQVNAFGPIHLMDNVLRSLDGQTGGVVPLSTFSVFSAHRCLQDRGHDLSLGQQGSPKPAQAPYRAVTQRTAVFQPSFGVPK